MTTKWLTSTMCVRSHTIWRWWWSQLCIIFFVFCYQYVLYVLYVLFDDSFCVSLYVWCFFSLRARKTGFPEVGKKDEPRYHQCSWTTSYVWLIVGLRGSKSGRDCGIVGVVEVPSKWACYLCWFHQATWETRESGRYSHSLNSIAPLHRRCDHRWLSIVKKMTKYKLVVEGDNEVV